MKQMDKLKNKAKNNKKMVVFLMTIFIIGIIVGSLFIVILSKSDKSLIKEYLEQFLNSINGNKLNYTDALISSLGSNIFYVLLIWLLGISVIGLPIMLFIYFSKAFMLGFSISSMLFHYKLKGILLALLYVFPHQILNVLVYSFLMVYSTSLSIRIIKSLIAKKTLDFKQIMAKYGMVLIISLVGIVISSLLEVFLMPNLIKLIIGIL